ncbi:MAG: DUF433 domain-containing protein [candidate division KSB1 bacterium]|nr:DUF433 domain-containing protein [candidate division KSB1 bacterium]MDZ7303499.1 DUF433 domain-containing protein [candidate division KSB1 bacterium]MDZ7312699.1 DUF433 domain-containing protein [candidate division KSB1 bacterium]
MPTRQNKTTAKRNNRGIIDHPHIWRKKGICGGSPVIRGTRFPVRSVVNYVLRQGMLPEELVDEFSYLTLAQVYDALSFYYDHRKEIDKELEKNTEEYWKRRLGDGK